MRTLLKYPRTPHLVGSRLQPGDEDLSRTLDLLYAYGAQVEIVYLESPEPVVKRRNTQRDGTLSNAALDQMLRRWEVPVPAEAHQVRYEISTP